MPSNMVVSPAKLIKGFASGMKLLSSISIFLSVFENYVDGGSDVDKDSGYNFTVGDCQCDDQRVVVWGIQSFDV